MPFPYFLAENRSVLAVYVRTWTKSFFQIVVGAQGEGFMQNIDTMFNALLETTMSPALEEKHRKQLMTVGDSMASMLHFILAKDTNIDNYMTAFHEKLQLYLSYVCEKSKAEPQKVRGAFSAAKMVLGSIQN